MKNFKPKAWYRLLHKHRFIHFLIIGGTGVLLNITLTTLFTELVLGRGRYFYAYLIGLFANLTYNFTLHTIITFMPTERHTRRFFFFIIYYLSMAALQAAIIKTLVDVIGVDYYLPVITATIGVFFVINFFVSKYWLFKKDDVQ